LGDDGLAVEGVNRPRSPWVDAFTYYSKAFNDWKFAPPSDVNAPELFAQGKLAMMICRPLADSALLHPERRRRPRLCSGASRAIRISRVAIVTPTGLLAHWHQRQQQEHGSRRAAVVNWFTTSKGAELWWRKASGDFPAQKSVLALFQTDPQFQEGTFAYIKVAADEATVDVRCRAH
jgi:hypothetical protein